LLKGRGMRNEQTARVFSVIVALTVAAGCGSVLESPDSGPDARTDTGSDGTRVPCGQLNDAACRVRTDCAIGMCAGACGGGSSFAGCYDPASETPPACPDSGVFCPAPCASLTDEASCTERTDCRANYCPGCNGASFFSGCSLPTDQARTCPAIACPAACSTMTTQESCDARSDCHSVFVDPGTCRCAIVGCCAHFSRCADGKAVCAPPPAATCTIAQPFCEAPAYVVSYAGGCYEGCVPAAACGVN
jgi:hypothetical protein